MYLFTKGSKTILIITIYRILQGSDQSIYTSLSQYNQWSREVKTVTTYRKEVFKSILQCIKEKDSINDIIIGDNIK